MSVIQGAVPFRYQVQPDRTITENIDGTLDGAVVYVTKSEYLDFLPDIGDTHPDDDRLELHTREITRSRHGLVTMRGHFRGLVDDPTEPVISYIGSPDREDIRAHPNFSTFAGSPTSPNVTSGALWVNLADGEPVPPGITAGQSNRYEFHSFSTNTSAALYGVDHYLAPSTQITLTHWQTKVPPVERMVIYTKEEVEGMVKGLKAPADVTDFLLLDTPYRQVGTFYEVSKIFLGSRDGAWSTTLYPQ